MTNEYAFEMATSAIRFGVGVTREVGAELADLGKQHVLVFTDPNLRALPPFDSVLESLEEHKIRFSIFCDLSVLSRATKSALLQVHSVLRNAISALRSASDKLSPKGWPFTA